MSVVNAPVCRTDRPRSRSSSTPLREGKPHEIGAIEVAPRALPHRALLN
jgi:hypothetical protein